MPGIPTVQDRVIQQAIAQILTAHYDPTFSEYSYGFRMGRSAHDAIKQSTACLEGGCRFIVEIDLAKFFDTVNHDRLMSRLEKDCADKALLKLIRRYLRTGIMSDGLVEAREEGTPQGSPLSPILSLIVLDELDKFLEKRGLRFCRYADDCNIYVQSRRAGERALATATKFIEETLKLRVNRDKSGVFRPGRAKFLGYTFWRWKPVAHPKSIDRLKKLKAVFFRARGSSRLATIRRLTMILRGWRNYFQLDLRKSVYYELDCHIRRHLRKLVWLAWKKPKRRMAALIKLGIPTAEARKAADVGAGAWRMSGTQTMHKAYPIDFFQHNKLYSLLEMK